MNYTDLMFTIDFVLLLVLLAMASWNAYCNFQISKINKANRKRVKCPKGNVDDIKVLQGMLEDGRKMKAKKAPQGKN